MQDWKIGGLNRRDGKYRTDQVRRSIDDTRKDTVCQID